MHLTLIGMSGCGKSHWSKALVPQGFKRFACDEMIARHLSTFLKNRDDSNRELGEWMGFPFQPGYRDRERRYLEIEAEVVREIVEDFESGTLDKSMDTVVDSTGSLIYLDGQLLERLKRHTAFVYFHAPPSLWEEVTLLYSAHPRPVVWNGMYHRRPEETEEQALARCYRELIVSRDRLYGRYADVTVSGETIREGRFDSLRLVGEIRSKLAAV